MNLVILDHATKSSQPTVYSVIVNFICQLGQTIVPKNQLTLSKRDYFREHEWASSNDVVDNLKSKNRSFPEKMEFSFKIVTENLHKLPAFQTIVQIRDSRLQL